MMAPSEIASLERRLAAPEAQLRRQCRMLAASGIVVAVILVGLLMPGQWGVVTGFLLAVGVIGGALLFLSSLLGTLELWSPDSHLPVGSPREPRPSCNP